MLAIQRPRIDTGPFIFGHKPRETLSFRQFIKRVAPSFRFYRHIDNLISVLQRVADGELSRVIILMPPRHGKSETVSRLFSAYYLYRYPSRWIGLSSYAAELAYTLSRNARANYLAAGGQLSPGAEAVKHWESPSGGGLWAAGVGGPITGKGFHLGVVDDPLKNSEEAGSETIRAKQKDWYRSTFLTRAEPGAAIIIIQTRWHEDDLSGWLLAQEDEDDDGAEHWHIVSMAALKEEEPPKIPATCTLELDTRQSGEALCPERYNVTRLRKVRSRLGTYFWNALYQQRPQPLEGTLIKRSWFKFVDAAPAKAWRMRYWDKASSTSKQAKFTAGVKLAIGADGTVFVEHVVRGQWSTQERRKVMRSTAEVDGIATSIQIEQEPGSSGLDSAQDEIRMLAGFAAHADRPTGDKDTRLLPFAAQLEAGNVYLVRGAWNSDFIDELCAVPNGTYRDQADAVAGAFNRLIESISIPDDQIVVYEDPVAISPI